MIILDSFFPVMGHFMNCLGCWSDWSFTMWTMPIICWIQSYLLWSILRDEMENNIFSRFVMILWWLHGIVIGKTHHAVDGRNRAPAGRLVDGLSHYPICMASCGKLEWNLAVPMQPQHFILWYVDIRCLKPCRPSRIWLEWPCSRPSPGFAPNIKSKT